LSLAIPWGLSTEIRGIDLFVDDILGARSSINSLTTMRPYHCRNNIIVGANCIRPL